MQFLALSADLAIAPKAQDKYRHVQDVKCPSCGATYHLWAPFREAGASEVQAQI